MFRRWQYSGLALWAIGCGRPATVEDCEVIVERVARLQILESRPMSSKETLDREVQTEKTLLRQRMQERCVGKRINESTLKCVQAAKTSNDAVEKCFD